MAQLTFEFYEPPTGKICTKCNEWKPLNEFYKKKRNHDGLKYMCKKCVDAYTYEYRVKNPKIIRACDRRYRARHHEEIKARHREYDKRRRPKKPETIERESLYEQGLRRCGKCKQIKAFNEFHKHPNGYNGRRSTCKECDQIQGYIWAHNNPDKIKAAKIKRHTHKSGAGGSYTTEEWQALCEQYDNRCLCCGEEKPLTHDHIIPISKGGHSNISNLQPLCHSCNCKKHTKTTDYRPSILPSPQT